MSYIYTPKEFFLSNSSLNRGEDCAKKLFVSKFFPSEERKMDGIPALVGQAMHRGIQHFLEFGKETDAIYTMMQNFPLEECPDPKHDRSLEACYGTMQEIFMSPFFQQYEPVWINVNGVKKCALEVPFKIRMDGAFLDRANAIPISYIGFIDAILFDRVTGSYIVVDFKTHRNRMHDLSGMYRFDGQCLPYGLALEQLLGRDVKTGLDVIYLSIFIDEKDPTVKTYKYGKTYEDIQWWLHKLQLSVYQYQYMFQNEFWPRTNDGRHCMPYNSKCHVLDFCSLQDPAAIYKHIYADMKPEKIKDQSFEPWIEFNLKAA